MRLEPDSIYHYLKNARFNNVTFNEETILEIQECIRIKNAFDDFKKDNNIPLEWPEIK